MEKFGIQPSAKPKLLSSSKKGTSPAPNWQSSIDEGSSKSIQALSHPALDSKLLREISDKLPNENEIVSLSEISVQFLQFLPLRVKVVTGFCAENDKDPTLDIDDICNIHLSKRTEVVTIRDITGGHYSIPIYSSLQFGIVYDPGNETKVFNSVSEIINAKPLPKAIVAMEQYSGRAPKALFIANELLLIQSISKKGGQRSSLSVYSITSSTNKDIPGDCVARFSTAPWLTKLYLSDMMECMNDPLPCKARLYFDESTSLLPEFLSREIVTVEERRTNSSFLISLELEKHRRGKQTEVKDLIDIPTCIGIDVHILSPLKTKKRYQKLYENTAHLLKEFNLTEVRACVDAPSDDVYVTQAQLLAQCRQGYESVGLNIDTPSIIGEYQPLIPASFDPAPQYEELDVIASKMTKEPPRSVISVPPPVRKKPPPTSKTQDNTQILPSMESGQAFRKCPSLKDKVVVSPPPRSVISVPPPIRKKPPPTSKTQDNTQILPSMESGQEIPLLPPRQKPTTFLKSKSFNQDLEGAVVAKPKLSPPPTAPPTTTVGLSSLETTISQLSDRLRMVENQLSLMVADMKKLKALNGMDASDYSSLKSVPLLTRDDVLNLLDHLNLSQYKDRFRQEMVDGEILSEIDESVLQQELGMTSKIHRLRLMKYIESHGQNHNTHTLIAVDKSYSN